MYGPGAFISGRARDIQPPGAPTITMIRQTNNRSWKLSIGLPALDEDGGPRTGLVGFSVLTVQADGANPFAGKRFEEAVKVEGVKRYDFSIELDEDPDHQDVEVPIIGLDVGEDQHFGVWCADEAADGADPLEPGDDGESTPPDTAGDTASETTPPGEPVAGPDGSGS